MIATANATKQRERQGKRNGGQGVSKKPGEDRAKWIPRRFIKIIKF